MAAAKLATLKQGRPELNASIEAISQPDAAGLLNVSRSAVQRAREVLNEGVPELIEAVEQGEIAVSAAIRRMLEPVERDAALKRMSEGGRSGNLPPLMLAKPVRQSVRRLPCVSAPAGKTGGKTGNKTRAKNLLISM